jgi:hypothetical protein
MIHTCKQKNVKTINTRNEKCDMTEVLCTFFNITIDTQNSVLHWLTLHILTLHFRIGASHWVDTSIYRIGASHWVDISIYRISQSYLVIVNIKKHASSELQPLLRRLITFLHSVLWADRIWHRVHRSIGIFLILT